MRSTSRKISLLTLVLIVTIAALAPAPALAAPGDLDTTFAGDGRQTTDISTLYDYAYGVAIQADGRIVAVGQTANGPASDFGVVRYNSTDMDVVVKRLRSRQGLQAPWVGCRVVVLTAGCARVSG